MTAVNTRISLPIGGSLMLTPPPGHLDPALVEYLNQMNRQLQDHARQQFANVQLVATAINSGTMATFVISAGSVITFVNGIASSVG